MTRKDIELYAEECQCKIILIDGHDDAIIGLTCIEDVWHAAYSRDKIQSKLMKRDGMTLDEADEFIYCNIERALPCLNSGYPILIEE